MTRLEPVAAELSALGVSDLQVFALTLWGETRGKGAAGALAVAWVIWNRRQSGRWPDLWSVCLARRQFSCWFAGGGAQNHAAVMAEARRVAAGRPSPSFHRCRWIAEGFVAGWMPPGDPTGGARHYYNPAAMVPPGRVPPHLAGLAPSAEIGGHLFFVGVA